MVVRLIFLFFLLPPFLFSGEFTASVERNQINVGESFTLNLTLKDTSAQGAPSIGALKKTFSINSQQQSSNTVFMNGHRSSSITWRVALTPQMEGEATIPSISINTSDGTLTSDPIRISVVKGNPTASDSDIKEITFTADVSQAKPYKNEPVIYTVKLASKIDLSNIRVQKLNIEDAIVESNGEPKIYKRIVDGIKVDVIEFGYLITPLKAGPLKIPAIIIQGDIPIRRKSRQGSVFDDSESFFRMLAFDQLKPFTLATEEVVLDVQPALVDMNPWLPARSLRIEEIWDESQTLQAGEPIIRGFKIVAEGIMSSQLPSLNDLQIKDNSFKIYADKPESGDEIKDGTIHSFRKEQYTLIPQQSGALTLPEISLAWWDVAKKERVFAHIPSRTLQIKGGVENAKSQITRTEEERLPIPAFRNELVQRDSIFYVLMAGLAVLLLSAILWVIALQKKIGRLTEKAGTGDLKIADKPDSSRQPLRSNAEARRPTKDKNEKLPDLNPT